MLPAEPALRRRIVIASILVVVLPFGFLYAFELGINHVILPLLEALGHGPYHGRFVISPVFAVLVVFGGLTVQAWFGPRTVVGQLGVYRPREQQYPDLEPTVVRLAKQTEIPPPSVRVTRNDAPNAFAVHGPTGGTVVVTTGLLERLSPEELEAVLAHELAHLKNRDATVMTIAWLLPTITYYLAIGTAWLLYGLFRVVGSSNSSGGNRGAAQVLVILVVTALLTLAISALFWAASVLVHRVLSQYREFAADRAAVSMTGDPTALATALQTIDEAMPSVPDHDLRRLDGGTEALCIAPLEGRAFTDAELVSTDIFPDTHPSTDERIDRLQMMVKEVS